MRQYIVSFVCFLSPFGFGQGFTVTTVAGNGVLGFSGDNGPAINAEIYAIAGLATDPAGNLYIADTGNSRIRKVSPSGIITTVAGNGTPGYSGDNGKATSASVNFPHGVALDAAGNLYIADTGNYAIRKVDSSGIITTIAGIGTFGFAGDGGPALLAQMTDVVDITFDTAGNLYFADRSNRRIRKIDLKGIVSTIAGTGVASFTGDGGPALNATMFSPNSMSFDSTGNLYFADLGNNAVRKITPAGILTTVAGQGANGAGFSGDGGPARAAALRDPQSIVVDRAGNLYIADEDNVRVRVVTPDGNINTIAGDGTIGFAGDGGPALKAEFNLPVGLAIGPTGIIYMVDSFNRRVRALIPVPTVPAITPGGVVSASAFGQFTATSPGDWIEIYGTNLASGVNTWSNSFSGINAPTSLSGTSVTVGGVPAFMQYADSGHINAQVPSNVAAGSQPIVVKTSVGASAPYPITVNLTEPGLLAPPSFQIGGTQYVVALFSDGATYVLPPGAIAGVPSRRATAGDTIILYGVGFGPVTPAIPAGQIVQQANALAATMQVSFGTTAVTPSYAGLAPSAIGLYQFNVVVPSVPAGDKTPLTFTLGGVSGTQTLYIAVQ